MTKPLLGRLAAVLPALLVGVGVFLWIRLQVAEWYLVPSRSMEPTLHGDPLHGDRVLVDKTAYRFRSPRRYDLVVVRGRGAEGEAFVVKRAVAFGDDARNWVSVRGGDVWLGTTRQDLAIDVKDPREATGQRVTHFEFLGAEPASAAAYFHRDANVAFASVPAAAVHLAPAAPDEEALWALLAPAAQDARRRAPEPDVYVPGHLSTAQPVDTTFLGADGAREGTSALHRDIGMQIELVPEPGCTGFQLVLEYHDDYYSFAWASDGALTFRAGGVEVPLPSAPAACARRAPPLQPGRALDVVFGHLDGWLFLSIDGELVHYRPADLAGMGPWNSRYGRRGNENLLHVGCSGGGALLRRVRVFHDVYYASLAGPFGDGPAPVELPPETMFLLGDNTRDSNDSRMGVLYSVHDLIGRPVAILAPGPRRRWLTP